MSYSWVPVNTCWGTDLCLSEMPRDRTIYLVRGSEMFKFVLPELPPPDTSVGTGVNRINQLLPDQKKEE
jgi:hypothetical protein